MSAFRPVNPMPFLQGLVGQPVVARLKWGPEYLGVLVATDQHMNIQLVDPEEFQDGNSAGVVKGDMLIRCNNILYIRELKTGKTDKTDTSAAMDTAPPPAPPSEDEQMEEGEQQGS
ncbi:hypothetical protein H4R18_002016 [Coemansia javaensis]|uniref:Sm protein F n=1 Tax=Coemansia javaensis TaxID=2761396 RepID=A0A9W8HC10_9FUNG|nr:hypothetical protein H4R18_002016 [Coemansia javaensis]